MRVRRGSDTVSPLDESQQFMLRHLVHYVDRLLDRDPKVDFEMLETIYWLLGPDIVQEELLPLAAMLEVGDKKRRFERDLNEEIRHRRDFAHLVDQALRRISDDEYACVVELLRGLLKKRLDHFTCFTASDIEKNLIAFEQMFGLTELERDLCLFFLLLSVYEEAQSLFEFYLKCDRYAGRCYLATALGTTPSDVSKAVHGKLTRIGILESRHGTVGLETDFLRLLQEPSANEISTQFFIYGNPEVGKKTYAYGLGKELGLDIYVCTHEGKEKHWQRQAAVMAPVHMASQNKGSLLIIDDCDSLLGTRHLWSLFGAYNDKKWIHEVLESPAKIVFIVNDVQFLEESVVRRFCFSVHFREFSRGQRIQLWKNILQDQKIGFAFTDAQVTELASRYSVSPGVIEQAVRTAAEMAPESNADLYQSVTIALQAHESLAQGGHVAVRPRAVDKNFVLDGLPVIGTDLPALLIDLEVFSGHLRNTESHGTPGVSLLFHGPSGTGKSHLARYIATRLDREVVVKRGSDLLSPYVGETEQRIRSAYEEAAAKEPVLIIDEAESLVLNRDRAQHSWELSFTNEFLNCMEEFRYIQIFTTNRLTDLDRATLRRFTYKLEFGYLKPEGNVVFYRELLAPLAASGLQDELEDELKGISSLTPGDFKVVLTKHRFKAPDEVSHESLRAALREEVRVKELHSGRKAVGF